LFWYKTYRTKATKLEPNPNNLDKIGEKRKEQSTLQLDAQEQIKMKSDTPPSKMA